MPNQSTREERAVAELRTAAAAASIRVARDLAAGSKTPTWRKALAATKA